MPLHLGPTSRRLFLGQVATSLAGLTILRPSWAASESAHPNRIALLSDTHIPDRPDVVARDVNMTANLKHVVQELTQSSEKPAAVMINGDCAYLRGLEKDYLNLAECVRPLSTAGIPLHLTLGNHDDREVMYQVLKTTKPTQPLVDSKHVTLLETPHANWFLLDSLLTTNLVTGNLGSAQLKWLAQALDAHADRPAIVMAHHNPQFEAPAAGKVWGGLQDTADLFAILKSRPQVKAYIFGHSHNWSLSQQEGLHLINLPPVAYVFGAGKPNGWVQADSQPNGLRLQLHTIDPRHPQQGEVAELTWR